MTSFDATLPMPATQDVAPERVKARWITAARLWHAGFVVLLAAFIWTLAIYFVPAITHPDANGYWAQGSLIFKTGHSYLRPESDAAYIGMHWLMIDPQTFVSRYPPGFPVLTGAVQELFGWRASVLVNPALAVLTLVGLYLTVSRLASPAFGLVAAALLAVNPPFAVHALTQISHMPVAFCVVWGVYLLLRWSESGRLGWVFGAGLVLGCIPGARYADAIVALGVIAFLLMHVRRFPGIWKHYLAAFVGAMIPVTPLLIRNQLLMGAFWKTGYSLTNEQTGFSLDFFMEHSISYLQSLQGGGLGMMFVLGLIGMIWMLALPRFRATSLMLLLAGVPFILLYMAYYWAMGVGGGAGNVGGALRFMVPIVPVFVIGGVWAMWQMLRDTPLGVRIAVPIVIVALQVLMYGSSLRQELRNSFERKSVLAQATDALEQTVPEGSVVVADQSLLQHLDFVRKWKLADLSVIEPRRGPGNARFGAPGGDDADAPTPQQKAKFEARQALYPGNDRQKRNKFLNDIEAWAGEQEIYVIGREDDLTRLLPGVGKEHLEIVQRVTTPKPPEPPPDARRSSRTRPFPGGPGGPARGGGPFGRFVQPGEEFVIAKWK